MPNQHTESVVEAALAAFLDLEKGRIDTMIEKINESIEKLQEYRSAIISTAVTGKIDVRDNRVSKTITT